MGGAVEPSFLNVGITNPGGFPFRPFSALPSVTKSWYKPTPPRTTHLPSPLGSQAKPARGLNTQFNDWLYTLLCCFMNPFVTCSCKVEADARWKFAKVVPPIGTGFPKLS